MIRVGIIAVDHVILNAIRGVLEPNEGLNILFASCFGPGEVPQDIRQPVDVLICEPMPLNELKRIAELCRKDGEEKKMPILILGEPPSERLLQRFLDIGARGFIGSSVWAFACMSEAIKTVARGELYMPRKALEIVSAVSSRSH